MLDYWHGDAKGSCILHRDDGFSLLVLEATWFGGSPFSALEQLALSRSTGRILDVGAGVGRHALFLQKQGRQVTAVEIEPELVSIMSERGVTEPLATSIYLLGGRQFDTILMLMNGFGLVGTPVGARLFFERTQQLLAPGGQILCDSLDVRHTSDPTHLAYQETNIRQGRPAGQMRFWMEYRGQRGEPFDWLHLEFEGLREMAQRQGWSAIMLAQEENGHYLARLVYDNPRTA